MKRYMPMCIPAVLGVLAVVALARAGETAPTVHCTTLPTCHAAAVWQKKKRLEAEASVVTRDSIQLAADQHRWVALWALVAIHRGDLRALGDTVWVGYMLPCESGDGKTFGDGANLPANATNDVGPYQVHGGSTNPVTNAYEAQALYDQPAPNGGRQPWAPSRHCWAALLAAHGEA